MKKTALILLAAALIGVSFTACNSKAVSSVSEEPLSSVGEESSSSEEEAPSLDEEPVLQSEETLAPVFANQIEDGVYAIEVTSSSSMFRIIDAQLTVTGEEMSAVLTLSGTGYEKLYLGTGEEALADTDDKCIYYVENAEGQYTYEIPVMALNQEIDVAAWSIRKETWYDRVLVFQSPSDSEDDTAKSAVEMPADGQYSIDVALSGGSGKVSVKSPTILTVTDGAATALITWSSPHYEHMLIGETYYYPLSNSEEGSTFEIPVAPGEELAVSAQTTAMSTPHQIDYTLSFDWTSLKSLAH